MMFSEFASKPHGFLGCVGFVHPSKHVSRRFSPVRSPNPVRSPVRSRARRATLSRLARRPSESVSRGVMNPGEELKMVTAKSPLVLSILRARTPGVRLAALGNPTEAVRGESFLQGVQKEGRDVRGLLDTPHQGTSRQLACKVMFAGEIH